MIVPFASFTYLYTTMDDHELPCDEVNRRNHPGGGPSLVQTTLIMANLTSIHVEIHTRKVPVKPRQCHQ